MNYFNHAGTSWPKPESVRTATARALEPTTIETWDRAFDEQHAVVASIIGARPQDLLLTPGCTSALQLAVSTIDWQRGDLCLLDPYAHNALAGPVLALRQRDVQVELLSMGNHAGDVDLAVRQIRRRPPRLIGLSMVASVTGDILVTDETLYELTSSAHEHGSRVLIDAAQAVGWLDVDVERSGVDLLAFGGHKGLQGPWGIGGLFHRSDGGGPTYCDGGSVDRAALAGVAAGIRWLAERPSRLARARDQLRQIQAVCKRANARCIGHPDPDHRTATLSVRPADRSPAVVANALRQRQITASSGLHCAPLAHETLGTMQGGTLRLSVGPSTTDDEIDRLCEALHDELR